MNTHSLNRLSLQEPPCYFARLVLTPLLALTLCLSGCVTTVQEKPVEDSDWKKNLVYPSPPDDPRFAFERTITNSADVTVPEDDSFNLRAALTGERRGGGEGMTKPYAVAVHQGRVFVTDSVTRSIVVFDVPQQKFFKFGETDTGAVSKPMGIDVDKNGNVYVADITARAIFVFNRDGKFLRRIGGRKGDFDRISSVTVDHEGTRVYAVDIGGVGSENHRVRVFDAINGKHLFDIGKRGNLPGEFNLPRDLAIGKDGRLYVVDGGNFRVQMFDRDGKYISSFGKVGKQMGDFARPKEIATDNEGNVYVIDTAFGNFQIFNPDGDLLMFIGDRGEGGGPARYMLPSGIFVDEDGRVYVVDQWFRKIDVFRPYAMKEGTGFLSVKETPVQNGKAGEKVAETKK